MKIILKYDNDTSDEESKELLEASTEQRGTNAIEDNKTLAF